MRFKKTYTMIPKCSLGLVTSNGCGHPCSKCDAATKSDIKVLQVPDDQPVIVSAFLDKEIIYTEDTVIATVEFDKPINKDEMLIECSYGIVTTAVQNNYNDNKRFNIIFSTTGDSLGKKNICIGYKGINRYFHVNIIKPLPKIMEVDLSPASLLHGGNVIITINMNRELEVNEPYPTLIIDTNAFDIIEEMKPLAITRAALRCVIQAKGEPGVYTVIAQYPGQEAITNKITIEEEDRVEWATKEDIDGLFPELDPDGGVIVPDPDQPPILVEWADEEDIDALFPELK